MKFRRQFRGLHFGYGTNDRVIINRPFSIWARRIRYVIKIWR